MGSSNPSTLLARVISAVVAASLLIGTFYWGGVEIFLWLLFLVQLRCVYEFQKIIQSYSSCNDYLAWWFSLNATLFFSSWFFFPEPHWPFIHVFLLIYICSSLWLCRRIFMNENLLKYIALSLLGFFYCSTLFGWAIHILKTPLGGEWFFTMLLVVFSGDIAAYFGGRALGKRKIFPRLSPKKTWAGSVSSIIGSLLAGLVMAHFFLPQKVFGLPILGLAFVASLLAQNGDFFESLLKRVTKIKDSGRIMPGHGGFLDRIDGVLFVTPLFYLAAKFWS